MLPAARVVGEEGTGAHARDGVAAHLGADGRVVIVASSIGRDWQENLEAVNAMLDTEGFEEAIAWLMANSPRWQETSYKFSKQCFALEGCNDVRFLVVVERWWWILTGNGST